MALYFLLTTLDEEDRGEDKKSAGQRCETNVAEVVTQENERRYQAQTKPARHAAQLFAETHRLVSMIDGPLELCGVELRKAVPQVTRNG
jgi:hypothetical protein